MKHKILWIIIVLLLGMAFFAKANPDNPTVIKINDLLGWQQNLVLTGMTDTGETLPTDLKGNSNVVVTDTPTKDIPLEEDQTPVMCTMEYAPVCAEVQVQCIRAPCPPIKQTFSNKCQMNANKLAKYLYQGQCKDDTAKTDCPLLSQPAPSFCTDGTIVAGGTDAKGCQLPPTCQK